MIVQFDTIELVFGHNAAPVRARTVAGLSGSETRDSVVVWRGRSRISLPLNPGYRRIYFIVGMMNSAPSLVPEGQRAVTVLVLV